MNQNNMPNGINNQQQVPNGMNNQQQMPNNGANPGKKLPKAVQKILNILKTGYH